MNHSVFRMTLDIHDAASQTALVIKNEDTVRRLSITLSDGGRPYAISEECTAVFTAQKPDGNIVFNDCQIDGNTIHYDVTPQTTAAVGVVSCEIRLYGADNGLLTSPQFTLIVAETIYHDGMPVESETEVTSLTSLISRATTVIHDGNEINAEGRALITDLEAKREELLAQIAATEEYANSAHSSAQAALQSKNDAALSAEQAGGSASTAVLAATSAEESKTAAAGHEANAAESKTAAAASAEAAKTSEEAAKQHADTIDTEQINANIAAKADDLFFDSATSLLYLMSNGQIIGTGVQVATTGGGGGGTTLEYVISMKNLLESRVITVSEGTKVELLFSYASVDEEGIDDGPGIGKIIVNNTTRQTFTAVQGNNPVDVTPYLASGSNTVKVQVENSEGAKKTLTYTVTVAAAYMSSNFDVSAPFTGEILFTYVPTGLAEKTVHFELDGTEIGTAVVTASGRQQSYPIPAQSHGAHSLRAWFECEIEGTTVTSNTISFAIICIEEGKTTPVIAVDVALLGTVEQYTNVVKKYRVYDPTSLTAAITLEANGENVGNLTVDRTEQTWTYRPTEVGELVQTIRCGDEFVSWSQTVTESTIKVEAETEALALHLSSYGRSNNEENPGVWESGNVSCVFDGFNFVSDGWLHDEEDNNVLRVTGDARLTIPYRMFGYDFRTTGKTVEVEMATREVLNYDAEVLTCYSGDRGFKIAAQQLRLASEQSVLGTRYKEDEHIRVSFVVEKRSENRLLMCYINGILSGAVQYPDDDDFSQSNPVGITVGSNDCTTDLYNIRVYDNNLTRYQILDNWIADTQNGGERMERYLRNDIYDAYGRVVVSKLPNDLPYLVLQASELPQFKGDKKTCSGYFVDPQNTERGFTFSNAQIDVQGTSSQYYYRKNYKIKFKNGLVLSDGTAAETYQMNEDAVPVDTFTMKADVASSEGAFNVVLSMLYNDLCPYKTPAQEADPKIRQTIEGFPIVIFWANGNDLQFLGKYNFNNDKGTEDVFGFQTGDESWEILQNGTERVGWHSADFSGSGWKTDFEARYPEDNTDITRLQALAAWLASTDTDQATGNAIEAVTYDSVEYTADTKEYRLAKFSAELSDHFIEDAIIFYYLFTEIFLSIDQREKNAFPTYLKDADRWIVLFYDADSSCGTDNKGNLAFDYYLEDIDYTEAGDPVYNGQNSVLWKNLRETRHDEIMEMYQTLRTSSQISYDAAIGRFNDHQSKWPEAIFNEDMYTKCIEPLILDGDGLYLPRLQGKKEQWMKWWLYNRFRYLDSKYVTGTSMTNRITIRAHQKASVFLKSYVNMYGHVYFNAAEVTNRMERGQEYEFPWPASGAEDPVIGINDADLLTSLGDLSPLMVELVDISGAPHLTHLKVGDGTEGYTNYSLNSITLGNNVLLRTLDCRNTPNLTMAPDVSGCTNIEEIYFDGSGITGLKLPNGGILKTLHLPGTMKNLTLLNQTALTEFVMPDAAIETLRLENNSDVVNPLAIFAGMPENSRVRIIGLNYEAESGTDVVNFIEKLNSMRGLDENGNNVDAAQLSGRVHVDSINSLQLETVEAAQVRYPGLTIEYDEVRDFIVQFYNGNTLLQTVEDVLPGATATYTGSTPTKTDADVPADWRFMGWSPEPTNVMSDMVCYAVFCFAGYTALKLVERTLSGDYVNDRVTTIGANAFRGNTGEIGLLSFPNATAIDAYKKYSYSDPTTEAFNNMTYVETLSLPKITEIPSRAFSYSKVKNFVLPNVTTVYGEGFYYLSNFKQLRLPHVQSIGSNCFQYTTSLIALILPGDTVCTLKDTLGYSSHNFGNGGTGYIYVPRALVDSYKAATNWSNYDTQFRALEDYTVDGTITGELDETKI